MVAVRKVAVVVGGSRGIGLAIARKLAHDGFSVAVLSRSQTTADEAARSLPSNDAKHAAFECDVRSSSSVQAALSLVQERMGAAASVLVNAAGVNADALLVRASDATIDDLLQTNLRGPIWTCRAVAKQMLAAKLSGCIVNVGSVVGSRGNVGQSIYSASKAGLAGLTRSLSKELGPKGIRVNLLAPGFVETDLTSSLTSDQVNSVLSKISLRRFGTAEDIADAALFLIRNPYITGQTLTVDGGMCL